MKRDWIITYSNSENGYVEFKKFYGREIIQCAGLQCPFYDVGCGISNIKEFRKGKTTIVIASRVSTVKTFDKIIVLNDGELEAFDTPQNLEKISPTYQKMVYLQKLEDEVSGRS